MSRLSTFLIYLQQIWTAVLLNFFRINDPYRLLGIALVLVAICLPLFIYPAMLTLDELKLMVLGEVLNNGKSLYSDVYTSTPPIGAWFFGWIEFVFGRSLVARHAIGLFLIFFQLSFFTYILIKNKAHHENTYLPGLIFGLLSVFSFDMISLTNELMASTVLLFAINNLFKEIEFRIQRDEVVLNLGLYLGIASLFVFSYSIFLPGTIILLAIFTRLTIRKSLLLIFGFLLPHSLIALYFFWQGEFSLLWENFYIGSFLSRYESNMSLSSLLYLAGIPLLFLFLSIIMLGRDARLTKYQSQLSQAMILWFILSLIVVFFTSGLKPQHLFIFIPPLSYFISHYILLIRRKKLAELTIWIFIISVVSVLYLARFNRISGVSYQSMFPLKSKYKYENRSILILGSDWGAFASNKLSSGFYEWNLCKNVFTHLNYFDNQVLIDKVFAEDKPEVIIDENDLMEEVFNKLPAWRIKYSKEGNIYILKH